MGTACKQNRTHILQGSSIIQKAHNINIQISTEAVVSHCQNILIILGWSINLLLIGYYHKFITLIGKLLFYISFAIMVFKHWKVNNNHKIWADLQTTKILINKYMDGEATITHIPAVASLVIHIS